MRRRPLPLWRELEAETGATLLAQYGSLDLGDWRTNREALAAAGLAFEVLEGREIARRFPLAVEAGESGLYQPDGGIVLAEGALFALHASAVSAGAQVLEETRVDSIETDDAGVTVTGAAALSGARWRSGLRRSS